MNNDVIKLGDISFVTKLAGFEHSKYIQHNATHEVNDVPLVIGKNVKNGKVIYKFDWYIPNEISNALPRSVLDKRCIVIPYVGSKLGELAVFRNDFKCHLGSNVAKVELLDETLDIFYLYYYLSSSYGQLQLFKGKQGSAQPNITMSSIRETVVVKFELDYQKKIAHILSTLDAKIDLNNRINQELESMAKLIYDYWFVQFDFPNAEGKPYKSSGGKMVYNEVLKREIPEGWEVVTLDQITEKVCVGFVGKCQPFFCSKNEGVPLIRTGNLSVDGLHMNNLKYVNHEFHNKNIKSQLTCGDILVARHGDSGLSSIYYKKAPANCLNVVIVKPMSNSNYSSEFLYQTLKSPSIINQVKSTSGGSVQGVVNTKSIANVKLAVPLDKNINIALNEIVQPIYKTIHNNKDQNQKLTELREWLLPMLMNGQVVVK